MKATSELDEPEIFEVAEGELVLQDANDSEKLFPSRPLRRRLRPPLKIFALCFQFLFS